MRPILGDVRSFRETIVHVADMTTGDDLALERLDCEAAAIRAIIVRKPWRADVLRDRLTTITRDARDIARRYA